MPRPHLQVGLLVENLADELQRRVFEGLNQEAARLGISVRSIAGGALARSGSAAQKNQLYDCISQAHFDGLVICAGPLSKLLGLAPLKEFLNTLAPLPMCCVGSAVRGLPSVSVDNAAGIRAALLHLSEDSGRRRIAFVRGPSGHAEVEERYEAYQAFLKDHGIAFNPELVAQGDLEAPSGAAAVHALIDERHVAFDALVAANDLMALGALNALLERGIPVPERVSVVGFDDIEPARFATAPLTTVKPPLVELGRHALGTVVRQHYGEAFEETLVLRGKLIERRSSCASARTSQLPEALTMRRVQSAAELLSLYQESKESLWEDLRAELDPAGLDSDWPAQLCNAFISEVCGRRTGLLKRITFVDYLEHLLLQVSAHSGDLSACQEVVAVLRGRLLAWLGDLPLQRDIAEQLWHKARVVISSIAERHQVQQRLEIAYWRRSVQELGPELMSCDSFEQLGAAIPVVLPQLGIPACYVCTYEPPASARLRIGFDLYAGSEYPVLLFPINTLLPPEVINTERRTSLIVESIHTHDRAIGYVVFEMGPTEPEVYALLRDYITGALRGIQLDYEAPEYVPEPPPGVIGVPDF